MQPGEYKLLLVALDKLDSASLHPAQFHTYKITKSLRCVVASSPSSTPSASRRETRAADGPELLILPEETRVSEDRLELILALDSLFKECGIRIKRSTSRDPDDSMPFVGRQLIVEDFFTEVAVSLSHVVKRSGQQRFDMAAFSLTGPAGSGKSRTLWEILRLLAEFGSESERSGSLVGKSGAPLLQQVLQQELVCRLALDFDPHQAAIQQLFEDKVEAKICIGIVVAAAYFGLSVATLIKKIRGEHMELFELDTVLGWVVWQIRSSLSDKQQRVPILLLVTSDNSQYMPSNAKYAQEMFTCFARYASSFGRPEDGAAVALMAAGTSVPALDKLLHTHLLPHRKALSPLDITEATAAVAGALAKNDDWCKWAHAHFAMAAATEAQAEADAAAAAAAEHAAAVAEAAAKAKAEAAAVAEAAAKAKAAAEARAEVAAEAAATAEPVAAAPPEANAETVAAAAAAAGTELQAAAIAKAAKEEAAHAATVAQAAAEAAAAAAAAARHARSQPGLPSGPLATAQSELMTAAAADQGSSSSSASGAAAPQLSRADIKQIFIAELGRSSALDLIAECGGRARHLGLLVDDLLDAAWVGGKHAYEPDALIAAMRFAFIKSAKRVMVDLPPVWYAVAADGGDRLELNDDVVSSIFSLAYSGIPVRLSQDLGDGHTLRAVAQAGTIYLEPVLGETDQPTGEFIVSLPRTTLRSAPPKCFTKHCITNWRVGEETGLQWEKVVSGQLVLQCQALRRFKQGAVATLSSVFAGALGSADVLGWQVDLEEKYCETQLARSQEQLFPSKPDDRAKVFDKVEQQMSNGKPKTFLVARYQEKVATGKSSHPRSWSGLTGRIIIADRFEGDSHPHIDIILPFNTAANQPSSSDGSSSGSGSSSNSKTLIIWVQVKKMGTTELDVEQLQFWHQQMRIMTREYDQHHQQVYAYVTTQKLKTKVLDMLEDPEYADLLVVPRQTFEVFCPALRGRMAVEQVRFYEMQKSKAGLA